MPASDHPRESNDGNYVVVARRYRPRGFDQLVGQDHVGRALTNAIETGRVGHAYLFTGARGVGKTSTARIFAKALNDPDGPTATPDNTTDVAQAIDAGEDVDVIEIDGASNRGIDEIRSLRANVGVRPSRCRYKIYIIDEVHMLTGAAFNALLKTLEEPPEHVKFIFCTTDPEKIPITVLSRCQRFDFAPVEVAKIVQRLREIVNAENGEADEMALELIARRAAGSLRDSQSLLEQVLSFSDGKLTAEQVHSMLGTADDQRLHELAKSMADRDAAEALRQLDAAVDAGVDPGRLAEQLLGYFRDLMAVTVGCDPTLQRHASVALHQELKELGQQWGLQTVLAVVGLIDQTLVRIRHSVYARVLLESTLIQICNLPDLQNIVDLAAAAGNTSGEEKKKRPIANPRSQPRDSASDPPRRESQGSSELDSKATVPVEHQSEPKQPDPDRSVGNTSAGASVNRGPSSSPAVAWNQASAEQVWQDTISRLDSSMTGTHAKVARSVRARGTHGLTLVFPPDGGLAMDRCQRPEHKNVIAATLAEVAGRTIALEFKLTPSVEATVVDQPSTKGPSPLQRMRDIESNELVKTCIEIFDAQIEKIDKPR